MIQFKPAEFDWGYVAWFRKHATAKWQKLGTYSALPQAMRRLVDLTRGRGGDGSQRFVCAAKWDSPDEFFASLEAA
jgi:hypothetical protein